jgi:DDB1- and CUL4-associated factor 7
MAASVDARGPQIVQLNEHTAEFEFKGRFDHPYPTTRILWAPRPLAASKDMLATTGDFLRLWNVRSSSVDFVALLNPNKNSEYCAPLTSFDWNLVDPNIIGTSSIDTTCTLWDIEVEKVQTQLIAHDKEVYDISFATGTNIFGTVGADGSLRLFDRRSLEHSTIMYEDPDMSPLLRLRWNLADPNYIACFAQDSMSTLIIDIRMPASPAAVLRAHSAAINSIEWAPHSSCHLCSVSDDNQALIWDLASLPKPIEDPILAYSAAKEVNNVVWPRSNPDWVTIAFEDKIQVLRV